MDGLETERMVLRPVGLGDVDALVELDGDPEVMRFLTGRPSTRAEVESRVRAALGHRWMAWSRGDRSFVGWFSIEPRPRQERELGYRLARSS